MWIVDSWEMQDWDTQQKQNCVEDLWCLSVRRHLLYCNGEPWSKLRIQKSTISVPLSKMWCLSWHLSHRKNTNITWMGLCSLGHQPLQRFGKESYTLNQQVQPLWLIKYWLFITHWFLIGREVQSWWPRGETPWAGKCFAC